MADPITPAVVNPIVKKGVSKLVDVITLVWYYQTYATSLRSDHLQLQTRLSDVQRVVTDARSSGLDIRLSVQKWLQEGNAKLEESDKFLESLHPAFSKCWKFTCDCNCKRRYDTATKAETLSKEIKTLLDRYPNESVSFEPRPPPLAPSLAAGYFATTSRKKFLKRLNSFSEKFVIGVYGKKGAGKTMLVKKLAVEMESSGKFNGVVLMNGKLDAKEIQQEIVERIGLNLTLQITQERARWLHDRLTNIGKVVFIIDDVERKIDLQNEIGIPWPDSNNGCRIVVVSRSLSVCEMMKMQVNLEVGPLSQDESLDLLDELAKEYSFASTTTTTTCKIQEVRDCISSKQAWFPGEIKDCILAFHKEPLQAFKWIAASVPCRDKTFMLDADALQIEHGEKPQHWRMSLNPSTSSMEAKLIEVWFLHIEGKAREEWLCPATNYGAYLVYKLMPDAKGFKDSQVEFIVSRSYKSCFLDPSRAAFLQKQKVIGDNDMPKTREDGWLEVEMGKFYNDGGSNPEVDLLVKDHNTAIAKSGLCIQGIELRPLEPK